MFDETSLFASLEEWLIKPFDELPAEAHQAIPLALQGSFWDEMDLEQRRAATKPWAMRNDPAMKVEQDHFRALYGRRYELEIELKEFEVAAAKTPVEIKTRNSEVKRLNGEIALIDAQLKEPYNQNPTVSIAGDHEVAVTEQGNDDDNRGVPETEQVEPNDQNIFRIENDLCHIIFQGEQLKIIKASRPLRAIADRLGAPNQEWRPQIASTCESLLDGKGKVAFETKFYELQEEILRCKSREAGESLDEQKIKFVGYIKENGGMIGEDGNISWFPSKRNIEWSTFQTNIRRGIETVKRISEPLALHLEKWLRTDYCYRPPVEENIQWIVDIEPEKNAGVHDPLENMSDEEKNIKTREFFTTDD